MTSNKATNNNAINLIVISNRTQLETTKKYNPSPSFSLHPTIMHGLYDGGHGGLDDFLNQLLQHPYLGRGFLWVFAEEGTLRTDKDQCNRKTKAIHTGIKCKSTSRSRPT